MNSDLILREPTLPGLVPNADIDRQIELFVNALVLDEGPPALPRLPTADERRALHARQMDLARAVRPISYAIAEQETAQKRIALLCNGWSQNRTVDASGLVATFVHDMMDLPLFSILRACDDVVKSRAKFSDGKGGERVIDPAYPISSAQLYAVALKHAAPARAREYRVRQILAVRKTATPVASPELRARMAESFAQLKAHLTGGIPAVDPVMVARGRARTLENNNESILREYQRMGIDPIYSGSGMLLSPTLARQRGMLSEPRPRNFIPES